MTLSSQTREHKIFSGCNFDTIPVLSAAAPAIDIIIDMFHGTNNIPSFAAIVTIIIILVWLYLLYPKICVTVCGMLFFTLLSKVIDYNFISCIAPTYRIKVPHVNLFLIKT